MFRYTKRTLVREILLWVAALVYLLPFYILVVTALKPDSEVFTTSGVTPPEQPTLGNFTEVLTAQGVCDGTIAFAPIGADGFGYDPVFLCGEKTFAQMTAAEKDAVSHRGKALEKFSQALEAFLKK